MGAGRGRALGALSSPAPVSESWVPLSSHRTGRLCTPPIPLLLVSCGSWPPVPTAPLTGSSPLRDQPTGEAAAPVTVTQPQLGDRPSRSGQERRCCLEGNSGGRTSGVGSAVHPGQVQGRGGEAGGRDLGAEPASRGPGPAGRQEADRVALVAPEARQRGRGAGDCPPGPGGPQGWACTSGLLLVSSGQEGPGAEGPEHRDVRPRRALHRGCAWSPNASCALRHTCVPCLLTVGR